jgi:hypothetical protein
LIHFLRLDQPYEKELVVIEVNAQNIVRALLDETTSNSSFVCMFGPYLADKGNGFTSLNNALAWFAGAYPKPVNKRSREKVLNSAIGAGYTIFQKVNSDVYVYTKELPVELSSVAKDRLTAWFGVNKDTLLMHRKSATDQGEPVLADRAIYAVKTKEPKSNHYIDILNREKDLEQQLKQAGYPVRNTPIVNSVEQAPSLGIQCDKAFEANGKGAYVMLVYDKGPAANSGIKAADYIVGITFLSSSLGKECSYAIKNDKDLVSCIVDTDTSKNIVLRVRRGNSILNFPIDLNLHQNAKTV